MSEDTQPAKEKEDAELEESELLNKKLAQKIINADFKNIASKVSAGKTLTAQELARVQSKATKGNGASVTVAKTITELAEVLGISRQTLYRWRSMTGAPSPKPNGTHSIIEWRQFMRDNELEHDAPDVEALRARKMLADIEDRELRTSVRKGEYFKREDVREAWQTGISKVRTLLESRFLNELPPLLVGKDAIAIREENQRALHEIYGELNASQIDDTE
jgi:transposase-like protein